MDNTKRRELAFDIETAPQKDQQKALKDYRLRKSNGETPEHPSQIQTKARITCIATEKIRSKKRKVFQHENEAKLLGNFLDYFATYKPDLKVGWGCGGDEEFILGRAYVHGIRLRGFLEPQLVDVQNIINNGGNNAWSHNKTQGLNAWSKEKYGETKIKVREHGGASGLYMDGKIDKLKQYCKKDVELTAKHWRDIKKIKDDNWVYAD